MRYRRFLPILLMLIAGCASPAVQSPTASPFPPPTPSRIPAATDAPDTPTPAPTPTETETTEPTSGPVIANFPIANCCTGRVISSGLYRLPAWLELPLTIEIADGWRVMNEQAAGLFALARGENALGNPSELIVFTNASSAGNIAAIQAQFAGEAVLMPLGEPAPFELAGFEGFRQDFSALPNPDYLGNPQDDIPPGVQFVDVVEQFFAPGFIWTTSTPEAQLQFIVVDTGDALLFVYLESTPLGFESLAADAGQMLETLMHETP